MVQRKWTKNDENFNNLKKANFQWVRRFKGNLELIISTYCRFVKWSATWILKFRAYNFYLL